MPSAFERSLAASKRRLARRERAAVAEIDATYRVAAKAFRADLAATQRAIAARRASGREVSQGMIFQEARGRELLDQAERAVRAISVTTETVVRGHGMAVIGEAQEDLRGQIIAAIGPGPEGAALPFATLPAESLHELTAALSPGSPLVEVIDGMAGQARQQVQDELVAGLARGDSPRVVGRQIMKIIGGQRARAELISQEAIFGAHRRATSASFKANKRLLNGWIWSAALDERTCFPAGVLVSGPRPHASSARHYVGELVVLTIADREQLSVTPNHPILTRRGWVAAGLLVKGDDVLGCSGSEDDVAGRVGVDDYQVPACIKDVTESLGVIGVEVPVSPPDFHGDGGESDVCVVRANGLLGNRGLTHADEHLPQGDLGLRHTHLTSTSRSVLMGAGDGDRCFDGNLPIALPDPVEDLTFAYRPGCNHKSLGLVQSATRYAHSLEARRDSAASNAILNGQTILRDTLSVSFGDFGVRQVQAIMTESPEFDVSGLSALCQGPEQSPGLEFGGEPLSTYAKARRHALRSLSGNVRGYRVLHVDRRSFAGHVYNLQTEPNWYLANGIIVANCVICYAKHGTEYTVEEELHSHVRCRCRQRPKTKSWADLGFPGVDEPPAMPLSLRRTGVDVFDALSEGDQRRVLGPGALALYSAGVVELPDFVQRTRHPVWGPGLRRRSIADATEAATKRRKGAAAKPRTMRRQEQDEPLVSVRERAA